MDRPVTICFTYFKSLAPCNLRAALYSVRMQDSSRVDSLIVVDNDTEDAPQRVQHEIDVLNFPIPVHLLSFKHGDPSKTHSWSTNLAMRHAVTPWVLFTRADYLLRFDALARFLEVIDGKPYDWNGFVTGNVSHLAMDVGVCEATDWRRTGPQTLQGGLVADYTCIDAGVWMSRAKAFSEVGGLNEALTAWGHAQTDFQYRMHASGAEFVRIPETMFWHPLHAAPRDIDLAHQQLADRGIDLRELWKRYEGPRVY